MTDKELRKLSRGDLMLIMLDQSREIERLQKRLSEAERALQDRTIKINQAGSIAEASLQHNGEFEAAAHNETTVRPDAGKGKNGLPEVLGRRICQISVRCGASRRAFGAALHDDTEKVKMDDLWAK